MTSEERIILINEYFKQPHASEFISPIQEYRRDGARYMLKISNKIGGLIEIGGIVNEKVAFVDGEGNYLNSPNSFTTDTIDYFLQNPKVRGYY